jgi:NAD(P)-dependent dehydrogenase (short-subunit alcohol dehydrogenase family)
MIGRAAAKQLAQAGFNLYIVDIRDAVFELSGELKALYSV